MRLDRGIVVILDRTDFFTCDQIAHDERTSAACNQARIERVERNDCGMIGEVEETDGIFAVRQMTEEDLEVLIPRMGRDIDDAAAFGILVSAISSRLVRIALVAGVILRTSQPIIRGEPNRHHSANCV